MREDLEALLRFLLPPQEMAVKKTKEKSKEKTDPEPKLSPSPERRRRRRPATVEMPLEHQDVIAREVVTRVEKALPRIKKQVASIPHAVLRSEHRLKKENPQQFINRVHQMIRAGEGRVTRIHMQKVKHVELQVDGELYFVIYNETANKIVTVHNGKERRKKRQKKKRSGGNKRRKTSLKQQVETAMNN